jgi:RNAse (barnase) inhibitor barstar
MGVFAFDESSWNRLDYVLLRSGGIALYHSQSVLAQDIEWLEEEDYLIHDFDCENWTSEDAFHADVAAKLGFPEYYGRNLNAFCDCLGDVTVPDRGGLAIVLRGVERVKLRESQFLWTILDIFAGVIKENLLFGRRLLLLLQSSDPRIAFEPVGAFPVSWNPGEWLNAKRGL